MPTTSPWHWERDKEKYHNNTRCGPGGQIPPQHRLAGTGGKPLCKDCAKLNSDGK
jgi:hypothetical protein